MRDTDALQKSCHGQLVDVVGIARTPNGATQDALAYEAVLLVKADGARVVGLDEQLEAPHPLGSGEVDDLFDDPTPEASSAEGWVHGEATEYRDV